MIRFPLPHNIYDYILNIVECHCIEGLLDYYMSDATLLYASEIRSDYGVASAKRVLTVSDASKDKSSDKLPEIRIKSW